MLKLNPLSTVNRAKHRDLMLDRFYEGLSRGFDELISDAPYHRDLLELLWDTIDEVLVGSPAELETIALAVRSLHPEFTAYAARKTKGTAPADEIHRNTLTLIEKSFDYRKFCVKDVGWNAYALVRAHNLRICPYCHAHHVSYHVDPAAATLADQYRVRPPLDHFLPKSRYPYLAVSLYNLVPSCAQCNSSIKSATDPLDLGLTSPHDASAVIKIGFSASGSIPAALGGTVDDVKITLKANGDPSSALLSAFLLQERYQWYRHEVKDLIDRYNEHLVLPTELRAVVSRERFVLGCPIVHADQRMIGLCLRDIYQELAENELV